MAKSQFRPLHDRVVSNVSTRRKDQGGIIIPTVPRKSPRRVRSRRVGPGRPRRIRQADPIDLKVGDAVCSASVGHRDQARSVKELLIMKKPTSWGAGVKAGLRVLP